LLAGMMRNPFNTVLRGRTWKGYVERSLLELSQQATQLTNVLKDIDNALTSLAHELDRLAAMVATAQREMQRVGARQELSADFSVHRFENAFVKPLVVNGEARAELAGNCRVLLAWRGSELLVLTLGPDEADRLRLGGDHPIDMVKAVLSGALSRATLVGGNRSELPRRNEDASWLITAIQIDPAAALAWLQDRQPGAGSSGNGGGADAGHTGREQSDYFTRLEGIARDLDRLDFHARAQGRGGGWRGCEDQACSEPFDVPEMLPRFAPAEPRRPAAVFLHNSYYHFNCLAEGLKRRGWDAVTVSLEMPDSAQRQFHHGEDINLYDPDPGVMKNRTREFFRTVPERFGALHFYGMGLPSFFPGNFENIGDPERISWDFLELRRHGVIIGYMPSGCLDGAPQSSILALTGGLCHRCVWQLQPDVCNDAKSLAWNRKLALLCDWVGLECDLATPERIGVKSVYGPVATALSPDRWHPDLVVPEPMRVDRREGEILVYHAVGNYATRRKAGRDIKGTGAVVAAIDRLKAEGLPVKLIFAHDVPSTEVYFLQVQADIVVDQLNYGRYGANAREAMMLGKPTICRLDPRQAQPLPPLRPIVEAPLINAREDTIEEVLRGLVVDAGRRLALAHASRQFAVAWHGEDACAARYEQVIDRIRAGLPPETPELYPSPVLDAPPMGPERRGLAP
jgi:hypothetical protein